MKEHNYEKVYRSFKIPDRSKTEGEGAGKVQPKSRDYEQLTLSDGLFYEIDYSNSPIPGAGKFVLKSERIEPPKKDEIRDLFYRMRDIARQYPTPFMNNPKFYDRRVQQGNARIFYRQAVMMKDFEDDYPEQAPFSSYFPYYQLMSYEQLRTYYTWRSHVRKGLVNPTSLSYVFLYIYELINNIGVEDPKDGLDKLMSFWASYKDFDSSVDKYIIRWLKDYHIYYDLPHSFKEFVNDNNLSGHYPNISDTENSFDLFCAISKYDIRKSAFFTEENSKLIRDCFNYVIKRIRQEFDKAGMSFNDFFFYPTKKLVSWIPFRGALFHNWLRQPDKKVVFSENEIYLCSSNEWRFSTVITTDSGRSFIAFVMKQMEAELRRVTKFKYKITVNSDMLKQDMLIKLKNSGISIEAIVKSATMEFYREVTKTVIRVDYASLVRIRQEAHTTQEALIVDDADTIADNLEDSEPDTYGFEKADTVEDEADDLDETYKGAGQAGMFAMEPISESDIWATLGEALSEYELQALAIILQGDSDMYGSIKEYADRNSIMLELLADGINEKAIDIIGDNILDNDFTIYEDYIEQVKGMVERL